MKPEETKLYTSPSTYLCGPEGMRNEVTMWYVASGIFMQELVRKHKGGDEFGGLKTDLGFELKDNLGLVTVLDICCGPGNFANYLGLVYSKIKVTGVDTNTVFLKDATQRLGKYGWKFVHADARNLNLEELFDFVLASSAYHHMEDADKPDFLCSIRRHLASGGKVIVCENFLPSYSNEKQRTKAIHSYYRQLRKYYSEGNGTKEALETIEEVYQLELSGNEEHKVCFSMFYEHISDAGFVIELDIPIWQPKGFVTNNAGSHVILLSPV